MRIRSTHGPFQYEILVCFVIATAEGTKDSRAGVSGETKGAFLRQNQINRDWK